MVLFFVLLFLMLRPWLCRFFYLNVFFCLVFSKPMSPLFTRREYITFQSLSANTAQLFLPKLQVIMETCCNFFDLLESQNIFSTKPGLKDWLLMDQAASSALSSFWWCFLTIFFLLKNLYLKVKLHGQLLAGSYWNVWNYWSQMIQIMSTITHQSHFSINHHLCFLNTTCLTSCGRKMFCNDWNSFSAMKLLSETWFILWK